MEGVLGMSMFLLVLILVLVVLSYIFWVVMFVDALKKRDLLWIALFIFSFFTGFLSGLLALIYYFAEYR